MSPPKTLVVSVGLSGVPVALAILTLQPELCILVHSVDSRAVAERVKEAVARHLPSVSWEMFGISNTAKESFASIHKRLGTDETGPRTDTLRGLLAGKRVTSFRLDYTGGTTVMVSGLVEFHYKFHHALHGGDRPALRSYIGEEDDVIRFDAPIAGRRDFPLFSGFSLAERVELNGYQLQVEGGEATIPGSPVEAGKNRQAAWDNWQTEANLANAAVAKRLGFVEAPPQLIQTNDRGKRIGVASELLLVALIAEKLVEIRDSTSVAKKAFPDAGVELLWSAKLLPPGMNNELVEFDVVCRIGNGIAVYEAKAALKKLSRDEIVTRAAWARAVFGPATMLRFLAATDNVNSNPNEPAAVSGIDTAIELARQGHLPFTDERIQRIGSLTLQPAVVIPGQGVHDQLPGADGDVPMVPTALETWWAVYSNLLTPDVVVGGLSDAARELMWAFDDPTAGGAATSVGPPPEGGGQLVSLHGGSPPVLALGARTTGFTGFTVVSDLEEGELRERRLGFLADAGQIVQLTLDPQRFDSIGGQLERLPNVAAYYITPSTKAATAALTVLALSTGRRLVHISATAAHQRSRIETRPATELAWDDLPLPWRDLLPSFVIDRGAPVVFNEYQGYIDQDWANAVAGKSATRQRALWAVSVVVERIRQQPGASSDEVGLPLQRNPVRGGTELPLLLLRGRRSAVALYPIWPGEQGISGKDYIRVVRFVTEQLFGPLVRVVVVAPKKSFLPGVGDRGQELPSDIDYAIRGEENFTRLQFFSYDPDGRDFAAVERSVTLEDVSAPQF